MKFFLWFFGTIAVVIIAIVIMFQVNANSGTLSKKLNDSLSATSVTPTPSPRKKDPASQNQLSNAQQQALATAANNSGTQAKIVSRNGNIMSIALQWPSDRVDGGGRFLDELIKQDMLADFKEEIKLQVNYDASGKKVYQAQFQITLK